MGWIVYLEKFSMVGLLGCGSEPVALVAEGTDSVSLSVSGRGPIDLILMDYEMPRMNGPEAVQRLRELGCTSWVVGVTGNALKEDTDYFLHYGADAVLTKPMTIDQLRDTCDMLGRSMKTHRIV